MVEINDPQGALRLYKILKVMFFVMFKSLFRVKVIGVQNIPTTGAVILCPNHVSNFDPPLVGTMMKRRVHYMTKQELFRFPLFAMVLRSIGAFPVRRGGMDRTCLRRTLALLNEEQVICIFPEGTRSRNGKLGKAHSGVSYFALNSQATVIPVAIIGNYKKLFSKLQITYGEPVDFSHIDKRDLQGATAILMTEIQSLLSENTIVL